MLPETAMLCFLCLGVFPLVVFTWLRFPVFHRIRMGWTLVLFVCLLLIVSDIALSYPENIRHGYPTCGSCHVSPSGGGATTAYGRGAGASFMSSFTYKDAENPVFGGLKLPDWLNLGGDTRYVYLKVKSDQFEIKRDFLMQNDLEVAVSPIPQITFDMSGGRYGEEQDFQYRRGYLKLNLSDNISFRGGKFMPAYGINFADHRIATRAPLGFGEGTETYNGELYLGTQYGEAFLARVYGNDTNVALADNVKAQTDQRTGYVGKAAVFIGDKVQLGASGQSMKLGKESYRQSAGAFALIGLHDRIYVMGEWDKLWEDGKTTDVAYGKIGFEVLPGVHVCPIGQVQGLTASYGAQLNWLPLTHFEFTGEYQRSMNTNGFTDSVVFLMHHYL